MVKRPVASQPEITPAHTEAPAWAIAFAGASVRLTLRCQRCGAVQLTISSELAVMARTFLKSYFRDGTPKLPADVTVLCPECEANT